MNGASRLTPQHGTIYIYIINLMTTLIVSTLNPTNENGLKWIEFFSIRMHILNLKANTFFGFNWIQLDSISFNWMQLD